MRKICVVTTNRADYGLLRWLMQELRDDPLVELQLIASGAHLSRRHGMTVGDIERDGYSVDAQVEMLADGDAPADAVAASARATTGFGAAFERLKPDLVVVLGDRYELLAVAQSALLLGIPLAHIHGGEVTEGAFDDAVRHAVSKLSHLHFPAASPFRERLVRMGESPDRVYEVGALGMESIARAELWSHDKLQKDLGIKLGDPFLLVTYHPATLGRTSDDEAGALIEALKHFKDATIWITGSNSDPGGLAIAARLQQFAQSDPGRIHYVQHLGLVRYLSAMNEANVVVGNSSSGIIEAPAIGTPTVDIGMRQQGRPRALSVINCAGRSSDIVAAIERALSPEMRAVAAERKSPYGGPGAAKKIARVLREHPLDGILIKKFFDAMQQTADVGMRMASTA